MAKKKVQKIPEKLIIKCPHCGKGTMAKVSIENSPQSYECPKCKNNVRCPIMQCCIICAFSKKRCPRSLYMEAKAKGLEIRGKV